MPIDIGSTSGATGSLSAPGIGSGLDVNGIVQQLVTADTQDKANQLSQQKTTVNAELSAVGTIKSAAASLNDAITALTQSVGNARTVSTSNSAALGATVTPGASVGSHSVVVQQLAQAQILSSAGFASATTQVGSGTLTLSVGTASFSVDLSGGATLAQVSDAINGASNNSGVTASIITSDDGAHLMLASNATGTASSITVTASGGDGGLDALQYGGGVVGGLSQYQAAQDAKLSVDGFAVTSGSNTVSSVVQGLTLTLTATSATPITVNVAQDLGATSQAVSSFVSAYNALNSAVAQQTSYNADTKTAAPLIGNIGISAMSQQLRSIAGSALGGNSFTTLSQIGITSNTDGSLTVDPNALNAALTSNTGAVANLLTGNNGLATQMQTQLAGTLSYDGFFNTQTSAYQAQLSSISDQNDTLNSRISQLTQMYTQQFTALDTLVSQLQSTSSWLTSALASLPGFTSNG